MRNTERRRKFRVCIGVAAASVTLGVGLSDRGAFGSDADTLDRLWGEAESLEIQIRRANARIAELRCLLPVLGETIPAGENKELDEARGKVAELQSRHEALRKEISLDGLERKLKDAQAARSILVDGLMTDCKPYQDILTRKSKAEAQVRELSPKMPKLSLDEARALNKARMEAHGLENDLYDLRKTRWGWTEVKAAQEAAAKAYEAAGAVRDAHQKELAETAKPLAEARKALAKILEKVVSGNEAGKTVTAEIAALEGEMERLKAASAEKQREAAGAGWKSVKVDLPAPGGGQKSAEKKETPASSTIELPPGHDRVRAVFLSFAAGVSGDPYVRGVCAGEGVAIVRISDRRIRIFDYTGEAPGVLMEHIHALAEKSGHPEVRTAPWVTAGCSASTLTARNVAYWKPERTVCAISFAGGNLHQNIDPGRTLKGVPFLCINGEFERYGPEGGGHSSGVAGIRPEYGMQTQWVMIREQLLRWRAQDPAYLVNLLVIPGADHAAWSHCVSRPTGLFIRKALQARLPKAAAEADQAVQCLPVRPESGWLTDQDLTSPAYQPAPYGEFEGSPAKAFWHFDRELAEASETVHRGGLWLPDPTKRYPVPADWPPAKK